MTTVAQYLETLRRIPDDIVLSMATRGIEPKDSATCICGWAIREDIARAVNVDAAEARKPLLVDCECASAFGGTAREWYDVFADIATAEHGELVEEAFVRRVQEAAGVAR